LICSGENIGALKKFTDRSGSLRFVAECPSILHVVLEKQRLWNVGVKPAPITRVIPQRLRIAEYQFADNVVHRCPFVRFEEIILTAAGGGRQRTRFPFPGR
jgi:hypothetical protein